MRVIGTSGRLDTPGRRGLIEPSPSSSWDEVRKLAPVAAVCCRAPPFRCWPEIRSHTGGISPSSKPFGIRDRRGTFDLSVKARLTSSRAWLFSFQRAYCWFSFRHSPEGYTPETKPGPFLLFRAGHRARAAGWPQAFNAVTRIQVEDFCRQDDCYCLRDFVLLQPVKPDSIANVRQHFAAACYSTKHCPRHLLARVAHRIPSTKERQATFKKICNDCVLWPKTCLSRPTPGPKTKGGHLFSAFFRQPLSKFPLPRTTLKLQRSLPWKASRS